MTEKSGGSGGSLGLIYEAGQWKTLAFQEMENAFALCEFIGRVHQNIYSFTTYRLSILIFLSRYRYSV